MHEYKITRWRVVDGDTIEADIDVGFHIVYAKKKIRMAGIDAPELRPRRSKFPTEEIRAVEKDRARAAKQYMVRLFQQAEIDEEEITLRSHKDATGKYGRIIGEIFINGGGINGGSVNDAMVEAGHAERSEGK